MNKRITSHLEAVIEIGATGIRLDVAQFGTDGFYEIIDHAEKPVLLGRDVFTTGLISQETVASCMNILHLFSELLQGWSISSKRTQLIATSAVRNARNRDVFLDRICVKTGFNVRVIDGIEENRLIYLAIRSCFRNDQSVFLKQNSLIAEIGGGSTEIMLLQNGKVVAAHSLSLGTILIRRQSPELTSSDRNINGFLEKYIRNACGNFNLEMSLKKISLFVGIGSEMSFAAEKAGRFLNSSCSIISRTSFIAFVTELVAYSADENMRRYGITYQEAEGYMISLRAYKMFLDLTGATEVLVPNVSIREGMCTAIASGPDQDIQEEFYSQVVTSAVFLGKKYKFDEAHCKNVSKLSLIIFDALTAEHCMDRHDRLLLETAAVLHDIGTFIRTSDHHIHSRYIIINSDIFGLSRDDIHIVATIALYHRSGKPEDDPDFYQLPRYERVTVLKLAAILRLADALDRSHNQSLELTSVTIKNAHLFLNTIAHNDMTLERTAIKEKSQLFEAVYGYTAILS